MKRFRIRTVRTNGTAYCHKRPSRRLYGVCQCGNLRRLPRIDLPDAPEAENPNHAPCSPPRGERGSICRGAPRPDTFCRPRRARRGHHTICAKLHANGPCRWALPFGAILKEGFEREIPRIHREWPEPCINERWTERLRRGEPGQGGGDLTGGIPWVGGRGVARRDINQGSPTCRHSVCRHVCRRSVYG